MKLSCLLLCILLSLTATAQEHQKALRKLVVADMETRIPVRNVVVKTNDGYTDTTNYRGICHVPQTFDTLYVVKRNYLTEVLVRQEIKDSTFLIPNSKRISEVIVWGKDRAVILQENVDKWSKKAREHAPVGGGEGMVNVSFDFARMLDKRYRRDVKHLKKTYKTFKEMDKYDDDPIVNAYKKYMEEKKRQADLNKRVQEDKERLRKEDELKRQQRHIQDSVRTSP